MNQLEIVDKLLASVDACGDDIDFMYEHVMFHATTQTLSLKFDPQLQPNQESSSWDVMIQKRVLVYGRAHRFLASAATPRSCSMGFGSTRPASASSTR
jgi:hypothetical protein